MWLLQRQPRLEYRRNKSEHFLSMLPPSTAIWVGRQADEQNSGSGSPFVPVTGNYLSFGDSKFVPGLPQACLDVLIRSAPTVTADVLSLWEELREIIYDLSPVKRGLGFAPEGVNTYYSANCTQLDAQVCLPFFKDNPLGPENTRLVKTGPQEYILRVAAANVQGPPLSITMSDGIRLTVAYGDYGWFLPLPCNNCG